jgi:hypothetical protein
MGSLIVARLFARSVAPRLRKHRPLPQVEQQEMAMFQNHSLNARFESDCGGNEIIVGEELPDFDQFLKILP